MRPLTAHFDDDVIKSMKGRVLVVGPCAAKEVSEKLIDRLGKGKVYMSHECNDLAAVVESMSHLMKVSLFKLAPPINPIKAFILLVQSRINKSSGRMTNPAANFIKLR